MEPENRDSEDIASRRQRERIKNQAQWMQVFAEYKASGYTVSKFCADRGIKGNAFYRWRNICNGGSRVSKRPKKSINPFIRIVADSSQPVEIKLPGAAVISIKHDSDLPLVVKMLKALEAAAC